MPTSNAPSSGSKLPAILRRIAMGGLTLSLSAFIAGSAMAQALPPETAGLPSAATSSAGAIGGMSNDPCPAPSAELARTPDDLGKIQADIDRYTLCMERAQLLQRLNDLAKENQDSLMESSGLSANNPGMKLNTLPDFAAQKQQIMSSVNAADVGAGSSGAAAAEAPPPKSEWTIVRILGSGSELSAQIGKADGVLARVRTGDTLPDGDGEVVQVSATSVDIVQDGERKSLRWNEGGR